MKGIKAVFFDMDGTLIDSVDNAVKCWIEAFKRKGINVSHRDMYRVIGKAAIDIAKELGKISDPREIDEVIDLARECFLNTWKQETRLYDGVVEILQYLKNKGYVLGLVTSSRLERAIMFLRYFGIEHYFDVIQGYESGIRGKPYPDLLIRVAERTGIKPGECVYVGDALVDCLAARYAGMYFIHIVREWSRNLDSNVCRPDFVIQDILEIKEIL